MKILFVDDEPRVLSGLKRLLRDMRDEWEMHFCLGSAEGLEAVRREPFDVVVSDMRMPAMDGAALLAEVKKIRPESVRIILSGESDSAAILRSMAVTHRYLDKPCDPHILKETIEFACSRARALVSDEAVARVLTRIDRLPSMPALYEKVVAEVERPNSSAVSLGELIETEVAMTAKLLQVVNSAAFGFPTPVERVSKAVAMLGIEHVKQLVLAVELFQQFRGRVGLDVLERTWNHSARALTLARRFAATLDDAKRAQDAACSAAMLHECGRLILVSSFPDRYQQVALRAARDGVCLDQAELDEFGVSHGRVGAFVLSLWGLPPSIAEGVAFHSSPGEAKTAGLVAGVVHAACLLSQDPQSEGILAGDLGRLGLGDRVETWRAIAGEAA